MKRYEIQFSLNEFTGSSLVYNFCNSMHAHWAIPQNSINCVNSGRIKTSEHNRTSFCKILSNFNLMMDIVYQHNW